MRPGKLLALLLCLIALPALAGNGNGNPSGGGSNRVFSLNTSPLLSQLPGTVIQVANANGTLSRIEVDSFGASAHVSLTRIDGTAAAPTALLSGDVIGGPNAWGYNGTSLVGPKAAVDFVASQNWSTSANGTQINFWTTLNSTTTPSLAFTIGNDGGLFSATATGGSKGPGTGNFNALYVGGNAITGGVSVTAASPDVVVSPSPGTGTFTVGLTAPINAQGSATSYTVLSTDMGKTVTHNSSSAVADTLAQAGTTGFEAGKSTTIINLGTGAATITPTTSTINGAATLVLGKNQFAYIISDGTNWVAAIGAAGVSVTAGSPDVQITPTPGTGTFTVAETNPIKLLLTSTPYTVLAADMGTTLVHNSSSSVATTLAAATATGFQAGAGYVEMNQGTGSLTITPTTSTINGNATLVLTQGQAAAVFSDGANWNALIGQGASTGSPAFLNVAQTFTAAQRGTPVAATLSTATFSEDFSAANHWTFALVHASCPCTISNPTNIVAGQSGILAIAQSSTGSDTVTWGSDFKFASGAPTLSTPASDVDDFSYYVRDATHIDVFTAGLNMH